MRSPSKIIAEAERRASGLEAIDPNLDLGNGYTLAAYRASIAETNAQENRFNLAVASCDEERGRLKSMEARLGKLTALYLKAVELRHGADSIAYKKAGGRAPAERRRPSRKPTVVPAMPSAPRADEPKA